MLRRLISLLCGGSANETEETETPAPKRGAAKKIPGWIGVDLDGTLAEYTAWKGIEHIGKPIPLMVQRVRLWHDAGYTIKIMTARASVPDGVEPIAKWLRKHGLPAFEITNEKDFEMLELWDDRAIQVVVNSGQPVLRMKHLARPKAPLLHDEKGGETCEMDK